MSFLEKTLKEIIFTADRNKLEERGLFINGKLFRQLNIGNYGIADLVEVSKIDPYFGSHGLDITVYELKKDKIGISAFMQAVRYIKGIERYLEWRGFSNEVFYHIVLIGSTLEDSFDSSFKYFPDMFPCNSDGSYFIRNYTYKYEIDGISFNEENGYKLINQGF